MVIADNEIAKYYDQHQKAIDWCQASLERQLAQMAVMKQLLIEAPPTPPSLIFRPLTMKPVNESSELPLNCWIQFNVESIVYKKKSTGSKRLKG